MKHDDAHEMMQSTVIETALEAMIEHIGAEPKSDRRDRTLEKLGAALALLRADDDA